MGLFIINTISKVYNTKKISDLMAEYVVKKRKKLSQVAVAKEIGVAKTTLFHKNPSADKLELIADFFEINIDELFIRNKKSKKVEKELPPELADIQYLKELLDLKNELIQKQNDLYDLQREIGDLKLENERLKFVCSSNSAQEKSANVG